ncbi:MAG: type I DNA topoisomerase [Saprospiraceae bacterium]|nr:type I DNA topoisomerase [Saprospiraceae bacterium]MCB9329306.1 type I DNA topoisomerase [Lewinellaceae bacterium]HPK09935.1 type I DNA topoisomerase [Saprospiraceae bacterium]
MGKKLLIVESPAKAKTIQKYLGDEFFVKSSYGHIRDLDKGEKGVNIDKDFEPTYVISPEKTKVVKELKDAKSKADEVWLATDEDREGEAISWHLCKVLNLKPEATPRIVFSEITKPAIQNAVKNPRKVDLNLVDAQQARRILDRLVGFELSGVLWRKIKGKLSAGRVQSVAVKLIVEKEREIRNFETTPFFKIQAIFNVLNDKNQATELKAEHPKRFESQEDAEVFIKKCIGAEFTISSIEKKPYKKNPAPPFTTSTLQQEASRKLGFSVSRTMQVAQRLYEQGFITYMRTDSPNLSNVAIAAIANEVGNNYGQKYVKTRQFKSKSQGAQEAHEAIRPTYIENNDAGSDRDQKRLYELIWKRTIASQMAPAEVEKTVAQIKINTLPDEVLEATGEVLLFDGFLKVYLESRDDDEDEDTKGMLPPLKIGQKLDLNEMTGTERYTRPPARYTEAGLVKKLEELGIGRPSTYAPTITKIMEADRGYVIKENKEGEDRNYAIIQLKNGKITHKTGKEKTGAIKNHLVPTDMGMVVTDFLEEHFDNVMDYSFTADVENELDTIAEGKMEWRSMLKKFYTPFHELVDETIETADRAKGRRDLGVDPKTGYKVLVQLTRFGPVVQIGDREELPEGEKPKFANLKRGQSMETINFDEAMELFQLPKTLGDYQGEEVIVNNGRYGPYVKFGDSFVNIPRGEDPLDMELDRAVELIKQKQKEDAPILQYQGMPVTKGKGRFGPFIKWNDMFINVSKKYDFDNLSKEDITELIDAKVKKEENRFVKQWPEENIAIENGRWGPFIRFKKKSYKLPRENGKAMTSERAETLSLEEVKKIIADQ